MISNIIVKDWNYVKETNILDGMFCSKIFLKFIVSQTFEMFIFEFNFNCFITVITIVFLLFVQECLKGIIFFSNESDPFTYTFSFWKENNIKLYVLLCHPFF